MPSEKAGISLAMLLFMLFISPIAGSYYGLLKSGDMHASERALQARLNTEDAFQQALFSINFLENVHGKFENNLNVRIKDIESAYSNSGQYFMSVDNVFKDLRDDIKDEIVRFTVFYVNGDIPERVGERIDTSRENMLLALRAKRDAVENLWCFYKYKNDIYKQRYMRASARSEDFFTLSQAKLADSILELSNEMVSRQGL